MKEAISVLSEKTVSLLFPVLFDASFWKQGNIKQSALGQLYALVYPLLIDGELEDSNVRQFSKNELQALLEVHLRKNDALIGQLEVLFSKLSNEESSGMEISNDSQIGDNSSFNTVIQNVKDSNIELATHHHYYDAKSSEIDKIRFFPLINEKVFGRTKELKKLRKAIKKNNTVCIRGMGGVGKSTLVQLFISVYQTDFNHIFYIPAQDDLLQSIATNDKLIQRLEAQDLVTDFNSGKSNSDALLEQLFEKINTIRGNGLLVIDQVDAKIYHTLEIIQSKIPDWKIVLVSRSHLASLPSFELWPLEPEEARKAFYWYYTSKKWNSKTAQKYPNLQDNMDAILKRIGNSPLLLKIVASFLRISRSDLSLAQLATMIRNGPLHDFDKLSAATDWDQGVSSVLNELFTLSGLNDQQRQLLSFFVLVPPEPIPLKRLKNYFKLDEADPYYISHLELLSKLGWMIMTESQNEEGGITRSFYCHQSVQEAIFPQLGVLSPAIYSKLVATLSLTFKESNGRKFAQALPFLSFPPSLFRRGAKKGKDLALLFSRYAWYLAFQRMFDQALQWAENCKLVADNTPREEVNLVPIAKTYRNIADVFRYIGYPQRGEDLLRKAIELLDHVEQNEEVSQLTFRYQERLIWAIWENGKLDQAEVEFNDLFSKYEAYQASLKIDTKFSMFYIGARIYKNSSNIDAALELAKQFTIREKDFVDALQKSRQVDFFQVLSDLHILMNDFQKVMPIIELLKQLKEEDLPKYYLIKSKKIIARLYFELGLFPSASQYAQIVVDDILDSELNGLFQEMIDAIAILSYDQGYEIPEPYFKYLRKLSDKPVSDSPFSLRSYFELNQQAQYLMIRQNKEEALKARKTAFEMVDNHLSKENEWLKITSINNYCSLLASFEGKQTLTEAWIKYLEQAISQFKAKIKKEIFIFAHFYDTLGMLYFRLKAFGVAKEYFEKAIQIIQEKFDGISHHHFLLGEYYNRLHYTCLALGDDKKAEEARKKSETIRTVQGIKKYRLEIVNS